jgi:polar amino acid transport system substrate-binding protein
VDAWISDRFVALEAVAKHPSLRVGDLLFTERVAMAVALSNNSLAEALNSALAELKKDGSFAKLSKEYFRVDVSCL